MALVWLGKHVENSCSYLSITVHCASNISFCSSVNRSSWSNIVSLSVRWTLPVPSPAPLFSDLPVLCDCIIGKLSSTSSSNRDGKVCEVGGGGAAEEEEEEVDSGRSINRSVIWLSCVISSPASTKESDLLMIEPAM